MTRDIATLLGLLLIPIWTIAHIRRLHARGHSGWYVLLLLIPLLNFLWFLYLLLAPNVEATVSVGGQRMGRASLSDRLGDDSVTIMVDRLITGIGEALERMKDRMKTPGTTGAAAASMTIDAMQLRMYLDSVVAMERLLKMEELDLMRADDLNEGSKKDRQTWRKRFEERNAGAREKLQEIEKKVTAITEQWI